MEPHILQGKRLIVFQAGLRDKSKGVWGSALARAIGALGAVRVNTGAVRYRWGTPGAECTHGGG